MISTEQSQGSYPTTFPDVGTPEWGIMNQRRAELIRKDIRGELTEAEREEYEVLQRLSLAAVDAAFPLRPNLQPANNNSEANGA